MYFNLFFGKKEWLGLFLVLKCVFFKGKIMTQRIAPTIGLLHTNSVQICIGNVRETRGIENIIFPNILL